MVSVKMVNVRLETTVYVNVQSYHKINVKTKFCAQIQTSTVTRQVYHVVPI